MRRASLILAVLLVLPGGMFVSHGLDNLKTFRHIRDVSIPRAEVRIQTALTELETASTSEEIEMRIASVEQAERSRAASIDGLDHERDTARDRLLGGGALLLGGIVLGLLAFRRRSGSRLHPSHGPANVGRDAPAPPQPRAA